jgi:hypothetical protein
MVTAYVTPGVNEQSLPDPYPTVIGVLPPPPALLAGAADDEDGAALLELATALQSET